jgi:hypothetical protein
MNGDRLFYSWLPAIGCLTILAVLSLIVLMPLVLVDLMRSALERLHPSPAAALASVIGIFIGSLFNLPVHRLRACDAGVGARRGGRGRTRRFSRRRGHAGFS